MGCSVAGLPQYDAAGSETIGEHRTVPSAARSSNGSKITSRTSKEPSANQTHRGLLLRPGSGEAVVELGHWRTSVWDRPIGRTSTWTSGSSLVDTLECHVFAGTTTRSPTAATNSSPSM